MAIVITKIRARKSGLETYLTLAFPMMISQATQTCMQFTDRIFLSNYKDNAGEVYLNAGLVGGLTSFFFIAFFVITAGYTNVFVAQYFGAKKPHMCAKVTSQALYIAMVVYPLIVLASFFTDDFFALFHHSPLQTQLESQYARIMLLGSIIMILRSGISGFFLGIGKSNIVMVSSLCGLLVNVPLNYVMIYGVGIFPEMGIQGAAIATVISALISLLIMLLIYLNTTYHRLYRTRTHITPQMPLLRKIIRYGTPSGIEVMFGVGVFDYFIIVMNAYGETVGSAVTIAINWDSMFFIPMLGASFATTSLVGQHIGAKDIAGAKRVTQLSFIVVCTYAVIVALLLLIFTHPLVSLFLGKMSSAATVYPLAVTMIRLACIYLVADAVHLTFLGALRGAGDTKASMYIFISITVAFGILITLFIRTQTILPLGAWWMFIGFAILMGIGMILRYAQGTWQRINLIEQR